ncbi:MAG TPA: hypothetical protein VKA27_17495 [Sunxiuqinia sp.]|nr:hypothetical protein [Sunxiuqinia sp.]
MNGIKQLSLRVGFFLVLLMVISTACKDNYNTSIPYVDVNFSINLVNHNALTTVGTPVFFNGGYGGIVVINTGTSYSAYDVTCPYEVDFKCRVEADGVIATCPCCGSQYNLLEGGYVVNGPSAEPLKQYHVNASGDILHITN